MDKYLKNTILAILLVLFTTILPPTTNKTTPPRTLQNWNRFVLPEDKKNPPKLSMFVPFAARDFNENGQFSMQVKVGKEVKEFIGKIEVRLLFGFREHAVLCIECSEYMWNIDL